MLKFKELRKNLLEYLTPEQEQKYSKHQMTPKARKDTDHFFGVGNDKVKEEIPDYHHDKSEVHRKIETHLGKELDHASYKSGKTTDKYGREVRLSKLIKDQNLQKEFAADSTRTGKNLKSPYMTVVRGTHVAGQTNSQPDELHPKGHSWGEESCKNNKNGMAKNFLPHEIKHGTVVVFGHDGDGKEIYRSTLHPHHNDDGDVAYSLESEYGIKHPDFTRHSHDVASRLSGEAPKESSKQIYTKDDRVYNDISSSYIMHPNTSSKDISKMLSSKDVDERTAAIGHPKATPKHISDGLDDSNFFVKRAAIENPNATAKHISKALDNKDIGIRKIAISHSKVTPEHITKALKDKSPAVRYTAIRHQKATPEHISKALDDNKSVVREVAIQHPKATPEHISKGLDDADDDVRLQAATHKNASSENISKALGNEDASVREAAISHSNATPEHISKALDDESHTIRLQALKHPNISSEHISKARKDKNKIVSAFAKTLVKSLRTKQ